MLVVLGALSAFGPLLTDMYLPGLLSMARDLGTGPSVTQLTLSACLIGLAIGQIIAGPISDARGRRRPLLIGLGAYVIASVLCAVAPSIGPLLAARFIHGLAGLGDGPRLRVELFVQDRDAPLICSGRRGSDSHPPRRQVRRSERIRHGAPSHGARVTSFPGGTRAQAIAAAARPGGFLSHLRGGQWRACSARSRKSSTSRL